MWNQISTNNLIQQRMHMKNYQIHLCNLSKMKSMINIKPPIKLQFVYNKPKLQMTRRDRLVDIDRQNQILLHKMQGIKIAKYTKNQLRPESQQLKTLNTHFMSQEAKKNQYQNKKICNAILKIQSYYTTAFSVDRIQTLQKLKYNSSAISKKTISSQDVNSRTSSPYRSRKIKSSNKFERSKLYLKASTESDLLSRKTKSSKQIRYRPFSTQIPRSSKKQIENEQQNAHKIK